MSFSYRHRMARRKYGQPGSRRRILFGAGKLFFGNQVYEVKDVEITMTQRPIPQKVFDYEREITHKIQSTFGLRKDQF